MVQNVDQGLKLKLLRGPKKGLAGNERAVLSLPITQGPHYDADTTQWQCLNFTRSSFYILLPAY